MNTSLISKAVFQQNVPLFQMLDGQIIDVCFFNRAVAMEGPGLGFMFQIQTAVMHGAMDLRLVVFYTL